MQTKDYRGILLLNKPEGFTSHDVVAKLRGILHQRQIGHGGTLDPLATGVLPVFVGGATKAADYAAAQEKEYIAGFTLGKRTDTQDITGTVLQTSDKTVALEAVKAALQTLSGAQKQLPPMYSAVKVQGRKLYELARQGQEVERQPRDILVHEIELLHFDGMQGQFRASVSKGTYVRTLVDTLGERLQTFAVLDSLVRTRAGQFTLDQTHTLQEVQDAACTGCLETLLLPTDTLFLSYPKVDLTARGAERAAHGAVVFPTDTDGTPQEPETICRVYYDGQFLMLGRIGTLDIGGIGLFVHKNFQ